MSDKQGEDGKSEGKNDQEEDKKDDEPEKKEDNDDDDDDDEDDDDDDDEQSDNKNEEVDDDGEDDDDDNDDDDEDDDESEDDDEDEDEDEDEEEEGEEEEDKNSVILDTDLVKIEENLSDADFLSNITNDSSSLIKSVKKWQEKYKLDISELIAEADKLLEESLTPADFGLTGMAAKVIDVLLSKTEEMDLNELLEYAKSYKM
ncbi:unnamed protein product [Dimorphilus gyrociliatus]|uniref:Uncharacterized protein n=1 Tax=Dimorphilus gyrociliatus TaxID=2664684 RepID=A0A7I8VH80_9ANNE|nr:unnamed protein product [Dimorphilus gyrociliatus]